MYVFGQFYMYIWLRNRQSGKLSALFLFFIAEKLTLGMEAFSADGSMAELFDSAAAACQPSESFVRPFFSNNLTPRPWELHSTSSDYFRELVLKQMLCAEVPLWNTSPKWCHTEVPCSFWVLMWCEGFLSLCIRDGNPSLCWNATKILSVFNLRTQTTRICCYI